MIHNILQFTQFFRSRHNFKNWRLHEFTKMNDFCVVPLMKFKHNEKTGLCDVGNWIFSKKIGNFLGILGDSKKRLIKKVI